MNGYAKTFFTPLGHPIICGSQDEATRVSEWLSWLADLHEERLARDSERRRPGGRCLAGFAGGQFCQERRSMNRFTFNSCPIHTAWI